MNSIGSSVRGEVRWVGEDGVSGSIAVTDEGSVINTDDQSLSDMEVARLIASLRNNEEPGNLGDDLAPGTFNSILKQAGLKS